MPEVEDRLVVRMEASLARFEKQMATARKTARSSSQDIEQRFDAMGKRMSASAQRGASGLSNVVNISSRGRFVLQNTAAQLGDIAVQLEGGTNPARVMAQQLPQIFGGFGVLGGVLGVVAPLLGTVAAVGIPLAAMFLTVGDGAEKSSEKIKTFEDRLSAAEGALSRAENAMQSASAGGLESLLEKYGEVTDAVRELAQELLDIEVRAAKLEIGNVINAALGPEFKAQMDAIFGGIGSAIIAPQPEDVEAAKTALREIQTEVDTLTANRQAVPFALLEDLRMAKEELAALQGDFANAVTLVGEMKLSPELAQQIAEAERGLQAAVKASDFRSVADGLAEVRRLIDEAGVAIDQAIRKELIQAEDKAREMANTIDESKVAAEGTAVAAGQIGTALGSGVSAAAALAQNLGISLATAQRLAALGPQGVNMNPDPSGKTYGGRGGDPRQMGGSALDIQTAKAGQWLENYKPPKTTGGGGRGGGKSKTSTDVLETGRQQVEQLQRQIEMIGRTDAQVAGLTAKYRALDAAKKAGVDVDATLAASGRTLREEIEGQADSVEALTAEYEASKLAHDEFQRGIDGIADAMADAIVGGKDLASSLRQVFQQIARDLISSGIRSLLTETFSFGGSKSGGGLGGGLLGSLFGGFKGWFADGGTLGAGQWGIAGEAGPEPVVGPATILPNSSMAGAATRVLVELGVPEGVTVSQVRQIAGDVSVDVIARNNRQTAERQRRA